MLIASVMRIFVCKVKTCLVRKYLQQIYTVYKGPTKELFNVQIRARIFLFQLIE